MAQACPLRNVHWVHVRPLETEHRVFYWRTWIHLFVDRECRELRTRCARGIHLSHRNIRFGIKCCIYTVFIMFFLNICVLLLMLITIFIFGQTIPYILILESCIALLIIFFLEYYKSPEILLNKEQCTVGLHWLKKRTVIIIIIFFLDIIQ